MAATLRSSAWEQCLGAMLRSAGYKQCLGAPAGRPCTGLAGGAGVQFITRRPADEEKQPPRVPVSAGPPEGARAPLASHWGATGKPPTDWDRQGGQTGGQWVANERS